MGNPGNGVNLTLVPNNTITWALSSSIGNQGESSFYKINAAITH